MPFSGKEQPVALRSRDQTLDHKGLWVNTEEREAAVAMGLCNQETSSTSLWR